MFKILQYGAVMLLIVLVALAYGRSQQVYRLLRKIKLGMHPLWEFMAVDWLRRRLLLSQDRKLRVIDMDRDEVVGDIEFSSPVYGVALAEPLGNGFVCHRAENAISVFELSSLRVIGRIEDVGAEPESLLYDVHSGRLFAFNSRGRLLTVIDPVQQAVTAILPLPGPVVWAAGNESGGLYILTSHTDQLLLVDTTTCAIVRYRTPVPGEAPGGMAFDHGRRLLFYAYDSRLMVVDVDEDEEVAIVPIGNHPGTVIYDPENALLCVANGEGHITIIKQLERHEYKVVQRMSTQTGCRMMMMDALTKKLYLPAQQYLSSRKPVPNSFELLVFEKKPEV